MFCFFFFILRVYGQEAEDERDQITPSFAFYSSAVPNYDVIWKKQIILHMKRMNWVQIMQNIHPTQHQKLLFRNLITADGMSLQNLHSTS